MMAHYVIFTDFIEVTWRKKITSYVKTDGRLQKRHSESNVVLPARSLYHFRFKSYGPLCDFHKSDDLDLELLSDFKKKKFGRSLIQITSAVKKIRTIGPVVWPVHREPTDKHANRQTDRQTDRGDQYTLQKSTILQSNERIIGDLACILIWPDLYLWPLAFDLDLWPWPWPSFIL